MCYDCTKYEGCKHWVELPLKNPGCRDQSLSSSEKLELSSIKAIAAPAVPEISTYPIYKYHTTEQDIRPLPDANIQDIVGLQHSGDTEYYHIPTDLFSSRTSPPIGTAFSTDYSYPPASVVTAWGLAQPLSLPAEHRIAIQPIIEECRSDSSSSSAGNSLSASSNECNPGPVSDFGTAIMAAFEHSQRQLGCSNCGNGLVLDIATFKSKLRDYISEVVQLPNTRRGAPLETNYNGFDGVPITASQSWNHETSNIPGATDPSTQSQQTNIPNFSIPYQNVHGVDSYCPVPSAPFGNENWGTVAPSSPEAENIPIGMVFDPAHYNIEDLSPSDLMALQHLYGRRIDLGSFLHPSFAPINDSGSSSYGSEREMSQGPASPSEGQIQYPTASSSSYSSSPLEESDIITNPYADYEGEGDILLPSYINPSQLLQRPPSFVPSALKISQDVEMGDGAVVQQDIVQSAGWPLPAQEVLPRQAEGNDRPSAPKSNHELCEIRYIKPPQQGLCPICDDEWKQMDPYRAQGCY